MATKTPLKAPFPYFGGKSKVADMVWDRIGNVDNFVEPFAGSLAVLLRRPEVGLTFYIRFLSDEVAQVADSEASKS